MSATNLAAVAAALSLKYGPQLMSQINQLAVLVSLLPIVKGEGKSNNWTAQFTGAADATAVTDGTARSSSDADAEIEVPAVLNWSLYDTVASVTDMAQSGTMSSLNAGSVAPIRGDLLLSRARDQIDRLMLGAATHLYSRN